MKIHKGSVCHPYRQSLQSAVCPGTCKEGERCLTAASMSWSIEDRNHIRIMEEHHMGNTDFKEILMERSSQRDRADELCLLTWLGGEENGIDEKAVEDFKCIYCCHEVRALLWQKVGIFTLMRGLQQEAHHLKVSTVQELKAKQWNTSSASGRWELESIRASPTARNQLNRGMKGTCWRNQSICLLTGQYSQLSKNAGKLLIASLCSLLMHLAINFLNRLVAAPSSLLSDRMDLQSSGP